MRIRNRGFTLLDALISAMIVACLSAIALPSYHHTILKSHRTVARIALLDLAARQENHRLAQRAFATRMGSLLVPFEGAQDSVRFLDPGGSWSAATEADSVYRMELLDPASRASIDTCGAADDDANGDPAALSATAIGPQLGDHACRQLILCFAGRPGAKTAFDDAGHSTPTTRDTCWGLRGG